MPILTPMISQASNKGLQPLGRRDDEYGILAVDIDLTSFYI